MNKDLIFDIWLSLVLVNKNINPKSLLDDFENTKELFVKGKDEIDFSQYPDSVKSAFMMQDLSLAKDIFDDCVKNNIEILKYNDGTYPEYLREIGNPPAVLYFKGDILRLSKPLLTVIGKRYPSPNGRRDAGYFSSEIEKAGIGIVTGFADGIETEVLKNTIAPITILPCGIKNASPKSNLKHLKRIIENGGLCLTEYPSMYAALPHHYKPRNRLLAGISDSTFVVEAGSTSGTAITVNFCMLYGKEVYALPGDIHTSHYAGNIKYIKNGASIVTHPSEIVYDYYMKYPSLVTKTESEDSINTDNLNETEKQIINVIRHKESTIDEIALNTGLPVKDININVISLEMSGYIKCIAPDTYAISK